MTLADQELRSGRNSQGCDWWRAATLADQELRAYRNVLKSPSSGRFWSSAACGTAGLAIVPKSGTIIPEMGTHKPAPDHATTTTGLAGALFTPVQQRVLGLLFGQPQRRFQSVELIRLAGSGTGATHRVLKRLAESGLVRASVEGRQLYYQANSKSPVFKELAGLVRKTVGIVGPLREALSPLAKGIRAAFVYGSIASGMDRAQSDIDLMVIADDLDYPALFEAVQAAERQLGRAVSPNLMSAKEWRRKRGQPDSFVARIKGRSRLFVIGSADDLDPAR
jgi:predicted nucleotidyltransferase